MENNEAARRSVEQLAGARMPADHGLASLGLLMQLGGSAFFGLMSLLALGTLLSGAASVLWPLFLIGAMGAVRSAFHRAAGSALIYGSVSGPFRATKTYIGISIAQTVLCILVLKHYGDMGVTSMISWSLLLLAWPATLGVLLASPRIKKFADDHVPASEDQGFEGASVLMVILGAMGTAFAALMLLVFFKLPSLSSPYALLIIGVFLMLLVRSVLHVVAGVKGVNGIDGDGATEAASRYYSFGVVSSVVTGGIMMVLLMMSTVRADDLFTIGLMIYLLLVWPLLLRRYYTERNFSVLLAGDEAPVHRRAPDAGLTALGWLLIAQAVIGLAMAVPDAVFDPSGSSLLAAFGSRFGDAMDFGGGRSPWWNVGLSGVQLWAGIELIRMSDRYKLAATIFGVVASLVTVYVHWPMVKSLLSDTGMLSGMANPMSLMPTAALVMALVVPVASIVLVHRKLTPEARARIVG